MESLEKTAWLSMLTNLLLVGIKTAVALISGSLAVTADAIHSLSDVLSSAIILMGIKIASRSVRGFPYGLYKVENLVAMATSVLILFAGYEIIKMAFTAPPSSLPTNIPVAVIGISATILITWRFSRYELHMGKETGSPCLMADAQHIWTDTLSSLLILLALFGSAIGFAIDKYAAVIVALLIIRSALTLLLDALRVLLDASLDYTSLDRIREIVLANPRVAKIKNIWARNAGRYKFVELDVVLRVRELKKGHQVSQEIENRVKMEFAQVDRILIHFQPLKTGMLTVGIPLAADRQTISEHFGEAPYYRLIKFQEVDGEIIEEKELNNPFLNATKAKGIKVSQWLLENGIDTMILNHDQSGKGPGFVLGNGGVEILLTKESNAAKAIALVRDEHKKSERENPA